VVVHKAKLEMETSVKMMTLTHRDKIHKEMTMQALDQVRRTGKQDKSKERVKHQLQVVLKSWEDKLTIFRDQTLAPYKLELQVNRL
jgi:hypothetical protein